MLFEHRWQIAPVGPEILRSPYQERYLVLLLGCQFHRQSVHEHPVLTQRLTVVGDKDHRTAPVVHVTQGVDQAVKQVVGIDDGVVVGIHEHPHMLLTLLHVSRHRFEHLKRLGIFIGILRTVTGTGMQHDQHLMLATCLYPFTKSFQQNSIMAGILTGELFAECIIREILVNMYRRLTPVGGAP